VTCLSNEQTDVFRELANIGMGKAGGALASLLGLEVVIDIPAVRFVNADDFGRELRERTITRAVRQAFSDGLEGEGLVLFDVKEGDLFAQDADLADDEYLLEVTNIVLGAFMSSIAEPLHKVLRYSPPVFSHPNDFEALPWKQGLMLDIELTSSEKASSCQLLIVFPDSGIEEIRDCLNLVLSDAA
jgi:chemotaxis protein CheC